MFAPWSKSYDRPRQHIKNQRHHFANKGPYSQSYVFFWVVTYRCESFTIKKAECWKTDIFKLWCWRRLQSPLDNREIKPVNPKINQPWIFTGRTDTNAKAPILWSSDVKSWLIGNDFDAGKDWRQEEKGTTEGEMVGWHHQLNGHEFEQILGDGEGQESLACCSSWDCEESNMTYQLHNNKIHIYIYIFIYNLFAYFCKVKYKKNKPEINEKTTEKW